VLGPAGPAWRETCARLRAWAKATAERKKKRNGPARDELRKRRRERPAGEVEEQVGPEGKGLLFFSKLFFLKLFQMGFELI